MDLSRAIKAEECLLSDVCKISRCAVSIDSGVPIKTVGQGVSSPCLVCIDSMAESNDHGMYSTQRVYRVKLPNEAVVSVGDVIVWSGRNLVVFEENSGNSLRVLTVCVCRELSGE